MEQIIKSLDLISNSQHFLKSNFYVLNKYWIEPRINKSTTDTPDSQTQVIIDQIVININLIDNELQKIIKKVIESNVFDQVMLTNTWIELEKLCMGTFDKFNFIFGIPPDYTQPIINWIDSDDRLVVAIQFIEEFKKVFGYKFLDLLDEETIKTFLQVLSHIKKLYLAHY
jgi:hypothetical protein